MAIVMELQLANMYPETNFSTEPPVPYISWKIVKKKKIFL